MKKSFLILSVLALAGTASAYDELVPGTAESPNYYFIQANRGNPYLAYTAEGTQLTYGKDDNAVTVTTNLVRTTSLSMANIWAVYEGEEEGTVVIKSATANVYLMGFYDQSGQASNELNSYATVVEEPVNIYVIGRNEAGSCFLALYDTNGWAYKNEENHDEGEYYYTLDATGNGVTCGNWVPANNSTNAENQTVLSGTIWWTTKFEVAEGQTVEEAWFDRCVNNALNSLNAFKQSVPQVSSALDAGIETINSVTNEGDYETKIDELLESAYAAANAEMMTCFNGKTWALKSVRRAEMDKAPADGPYMATDVVNGKYVPSTTYADPMTSFAFKSNGEGGYTLYNEATNTYVGIAVSQVENNGQMVDVENVAPVSDVAKALIVYPCMKGVDSYYGVALCRASDYTGNGLNFQSWAGGAISFWSVNDAGSVWSLMEVNPEGMKADVVAAVENALQPYIPNVYVIKDIFEKAISDVKALPYSAELLTKSNEIQDKAFADANELLATGLNNKAFALKYLRGNDFVAVGEVDGVETYVHAPNALEPNAQFVFQAADDGGYYIYNEETDTYFGPQQAEELDDKGNLKDNLTIAGDVDEAQDLYPVLFHKGDDKGEYYGIALPFIAGASDSTPAINMNAGNGLHAFRIGDPGSIWGIYDPAETSIEEIGASVAPAVTGIYDLSGRRLSAPVRGINIINGKKVLVK